MKLTQHILIASTALVLAGAASAQYKVFGVTQYRGTGFDRSIGNEWLGGTVHAHAYLRTSKSILGETGALDGAIRGSAKVLKQTAEVASVTALLSNTTANLSQTRQGQFRVRILGFDLINSSFQQDASFATRTWTYNLFSTPPSVSVPVGPFSVTLRGNAGCGLTVGANYYLPAATPSVSAYGLGRCWAFANAEVGVGIPGFGVGVGLEGRMFEQTLTVRGGANALTGFFGYATYTLTAVTLKLYAYVEALWQKWSTTLTNWSAGTVSLSIF